MYSAVFAFQQAQIREEESTRPTGPPDGTLGAFFRPDTAGRQPEDKAEL